jgi:hypothetical protein
LAGCTKLGRLDGERLPGNKAARQADGRWLQRTAQVLLGGFYGGVQNLPSAFECF